MDEHAAILARVNELHDKVDKLTRIVQGYDDNSIAGVYKLAHDRCPELVKQIMKILDTADSDFVKVGLIDELLVDMPRGF